MSPVQEEITGILAYFKKKTLSTQRESLFEIKHLNFKPYLMLLKRLLISWVYILTLFISYIDDTRSHYLLQILDKS